MLFGNVHRYLDVLGRFGPGLQSVLEAQHQESANYEQEPTDHLIDDFEYFEENGGISKAHAELDYQRNLASYKINLLISTL